MNLEKFTQKAQEALLEAQNIVIKNQQQELDDIHLHLALVTQEDGLIPMLLSGMNGSFQQYKSVLEDQVSKRPKVVGNAQPYASRKFNEKLIQAEEEAKEFKDDYVSVEHLYLAILNDKEVQKQLKPFGITKDAFLKRLAEVRKQHRVTTPNPESTYDALNRFGRDLVEEARNNKLDPVIGRDEEIRHAIRILSRRTKNNPVLIGEPGVGKTAVVEGLADRKSVV